MLPVGGRRETVLADYFGGRRLAEALHFLEFVFGLSSQHFWVPLWVTESCTEMKAQGALVSCDFGQPNIASVPP